MFLPVLLSDGIDIKVIIRNHSAGLDLFQMGNISPSQVKIRQAKTRQKADTTYIASQRPIGIPHISI